MVIYFSVFYICLGVLLVISLIKNNKKIGITGTYSGFVFGLIVYYTLVPLLTIINLEIIANKYNSIIHFIADKSIEDYIYSMLLTFIGFIVFNFFYKIGLFNKPKGFINKPSWDFDKEKAIKVFVFFGYFTLLFGGIPLILFFNAMGGIVNALSVSEVNRAFYSSLTDFVDYRSSLLVIPSRLITVAPFIFMLLVGYRKKVLDRWFFSFSFVLSILFFLFNAGRAPLIGFLMCFLYVALKIYFNKVWSKLIVLGILSLPLLDYLDELFIYFHSKQWQLDDINYIKYLYQFIHPFRNSLNLSDMVHIFGLRYGSDFITAFVNLIPGITFSQSYENTSLYINGPNWGILGGIPNDVITFGYIEFGFVGVIIIFGFIGYLFGKIDKSLKVFPESNAKNLITGAFVINSFFFVASADFEPFLRGNLVFILLSVVVIKSTKLKERVKV